MIKRAPQYLCRVLYYLVKLVGRLKGAVIALKLGPFFKWVGKHQKVTAWFTSVSLTVNIVMLRAENRQLVTDNNEVQVLKQRLLGRQTTLNNIDLALYEKIKMGSDFRISGTNRAYERTFGLRRSDILGKTNYDIAPREIAAGWQKIDSLVIHDWKPYDAIEYGNLNDSTYIPVYSHKWPFKDGLDSLVMGLSVPISDIRPVMDKEGEVRALELIISNDGPPPPPHLTKRKID